jgi:hypothetical protein
MLKKCLIAAAIFTACAAIVPETYIGPASAQRATIDRGVRHVSRREAIRIAERNGMIRVRSASLHGRLWVVSGETRRRRDIMRLTIDARTGRVVGRRYIHR